MSLNIVFCMSSYNKKENEIEVQVVIPPVIENNKKLENCNYFNTDRFNFNNKIFEAKVVKVYDGDTITVVFMIFGDYYKFSIRMDGYDSPEMRSKNPDLVKKELEKKWAHKSRDFLAGMIMNRVVLLKCKNFDKYGRILGTVELNGININGIMLACGYCRPYGGGHKHDWDFSGFEKMSLKNEAN
jgi:endonuclease YncB( thermonuclease family)